jgi:serpin B
MGGVQGFCRLAVLAGAALAAGWVLAAAEPAGSPPKPDETLVRYDNDFAMHLYAKLQAKPGNLFFSPVSLTTALTMASAGARGQTAQEMTAVLGVEAWMEKYLHSANAKLLADLKGDGKRPYELSIVSALWGQKGYSFLPEFTGQLKKDYGAGLEEADFKGDAEGACKTINTWVEKETKGKIKDPMSSGSVDALTRLVLTNAIYFKGDWVNPFPGGGTRVVDFFLAADKKTKAPLMWNIGSFRYLDSPEIKVLEMPYVGDDLAMVVLLPQKVDGLAAVEKDLTVEKVAGWIGKLAMVPYVEVWMPKFKMDSDFILKDTLAAMGMKLAFDPGKADFSGMNGGSERLCVNEVVHKAYVTVNEKGTEAAAATRMGFFGAGEDPDRPVFRADHPFIFLIRNVRNGAILFMGRVADPTK